MTSRRNAVAEYLAATRLFSQPARRFLAATALTWCAYGLNSVVFNLYLIEAGHRESFVGHVVSLNAAGMALCAIPAGMLADRWGRRRCLLLGAVMEGLALAVRALTGSPGVIGAASFLVGAGQSLYAIAAAPFISEHSTARERTHLFSAFFSVELLSAVIGSMLGGWTPSLLHLLPVGMRPDLLGAYRWTLLEGATLALAGAVPLSLLQRFQEQRLTHPKLTRDPEARKLIPIGANAFMLGAGAGLVIPFMNLYFSTRFKCSSAQIGVFFAVTQVTTALAAALGPALARRFGKLRTATASELLSLPFLITLGAEKNLEVAVVAFWLRATLMQSGSPLINTFVMESLPQNLRARSASVNHMVWNTGWAVSATLAGWIIQRFGYATPFYITAVLYATAATSFYLAFRHQPEVHSVETPGGEPAIPVEAALND
jgi:MFS family permease